MNVKTKLVEGKTVNIREIEESDAEFVAQLRTDATLNKHLSSIDGNIEKQREYIRNYHKKTNECYFVLESKQGERYGLGRMYNVTEESFVPGSWIIKKDAPLTAPIESIITLYEYAFFKLGLKRADIEVRKDNEKVIAFHKRFGAVYTGANELNVYMELTKEQYKITRNKYKKFVREI
ncbi:MAG TPA: GNAT family N-acetyltransferase [Candidatus Gastranaerophilales bacterium]|nr:GNAT family N-acetyltransferase [Candidatus Gastranaerophilales bacterium]